MNRKALLKKPIDGKNSKASLKNLHDTIQIEHLRRVDELIVLQHVIRRFKSNHEADFCMLLDLRRELGENLREAFPKNWEVPFFKDLFEKSLWCCMGFLDSQQNLHGLEKNGGEWAVPRLKDDLGHFLNASVLMQPDYLDIESIVEILDKFSPYIADISRRLNYTHFNSLLGLTSYVSGLKLYNHYINAKLKHHKILKPYIEDFLVNEESRWMFSEESDSDDDLSILLKTSCAAPLRTSKNIQIFGGQQHSITVNNIELKNRLVLSVPTDEAPDRIDDALRSFRSALMGEFVNNCGAYANISNENYSHSVFMTQFTHDACLIKDWNQLQSSITGLWSWDIKNKTGISIESAAFEVAKELEKIKKEIGHGIAIYQDDTIYEHHLKANKVIGPTTGKKQLKSTKIDNFITRTSEILGAKTDLII